MPEQKLIDDDSGKPLVDKVGGVSFFDSFGAFNYRVIDVLNKRNDVPRRLIDLLLAWAKQRGVDRKKAGIVSQATFGFYHPQPNSPRAPQSPPKKPKKAQKIFGPRVRGAFETIAFAMVVSTGKFEKFDEYHAAWEKLKANPADLDRLILHLMDRPIEGLLDELVCPFILAPSPGEGWLGARERRGGL